MRNAAAISAISALALTIAALGLSHESQQNRSPTSNFRISLSVSPFTELRLSSGITFTDGKFTASTPEELQRLFVTHGANEVYARIATTQKYRTGSGDHSMDRGIERARMAAALNLPFNPELGLFNIYGDARCQPPPDFSDYPEIKLLGAWTSLTLDQMLAVFRLYGAAAARQILQTHVKVRIWDLGNEVEFGIAGVAVQPMPGACDDTAGGPGWYKAPDTVDPAIGKMSIVALARMSEPNRIAWLQAHLWPHEAKILAAVADGIRSVDPHARFSTHVSGMSSVLPGQTVAFFKAMRDGGFAADELGVSYYPTSSNSPRDRLQAFKEMSTAAQRELGRPVFIAEFGYPAATMGGVFSWNVAVNGYPLTPEGQANFIRDLVAWGIGAGVLSGIRPWAPDLAAPGWAPMSFFALDGKTATARPALDSIADGARQSGSGESHGESFQPGGLRSFEIVPLETVSETSSNASIGDLNGDGHPDIVLVKGRHWQVTTKIFFGDGKGNFTPGPPLPSKATKSYSGSLADMTSSSATPRPGHLDIVLSNDQPDPKLVLVNDGKGNFTIGGAYGDPYWSTRNAAVGDLNGDGFPDIAVANRGMSSYVCFNDGNLHFTCRPLKDSPSAATVAIADMNGDGANDVIYACRDDCQSAIYFNDGKGNFDRKEPWGPPHSSTRAMAVADFDGDGQLDIAACHEDIGCFVYLNDGHGHFGPGIRFDTPKAVPYSMIAADLNRDGHPEILVGYVEAPGVIYFNDGTGKKFQPVPFGDGKGSIYGMAAGDLNGDGWPDVVVARSDAPCFIMFNRPPKK
ncbi:MAG: FG-GAP-like repeat-containing protein [Candidatus Acidiferrales bacterium]